MRTVRWRAAPVACGIVLLAASLPTVLLAATTTPASPPAAAAPGAAQVGMPQLNFANPLTTSQVVWMFVIFLALYVLVSRWGLPQVAEVVDSRAARIAGDLDAARQAKAEADAAVAELTAATRRAQAEAQGRIAEAVSQAKQEAAEQARTLNDKLEAQLAEAESRIAAARQAAMGALRQVAVETTATIVGRLAGEPPAPDAVDAAVGRAMTARSA